MLRELHKINLEVKMTELKIIRRNPEKITLEKLMEIPLEKREYEGCRKSKFNSKEWNSSGKHYTLKGLYNLSETSEIHLVFDDGIEDDLNRYKKSKENLSKVI